MKMAFRYQDGKSDKFWWIAQSKKELVINYGKTGTFGKFELKDFDTEEECMKEAEKRIREKKRKGYVENPFFDFDRICYFDDEEYGPHPLTSHPKFVAHFPEEFYYSCIDEEAPFGSDEGNDTLWLITELLRKKRRVVFSEIPQYIIEQEWGMRYIPVESLDTEIVKKHFAEEEIEIIQSDMVTYAAAFSQIKITGKLDLKLKTDGIQALKRFQITAILQELTTEKSPVLSEMIERLSAF